MSPCQSAPARSEDDLRSVFLRIPPDDPERLFRASLVCTSWRRILTSPDFGRLYRKFHGAPPMLGFFINSWPRNGYGSRFIPSTAFRLPAGIDSYPSNWRILDSRHGRILVGLVDEDDDGLYFSGYIVWDPITNGRLGVPSPGRNVRSLTGAVLCAKEHCDHLGCHGPPFLVAMVDSPYDGTTSACVYSSESGLWTDVITLEHRDFIDSCGGSILVRNTLHFPLAPSNGVLQYELGEQKLSVIDVPDKNWDDERLVLISAKEGVLEFVGWRGTSLSLWSTEAGALAWTQHVVIDLQKLLPPRAFEPKLDDGDDEDEDELKPFVSAFAEGTVFLSTMAGLYTVDLNSGRPEKVDEEEMAFHVIPWTSFYTLDHTRRTRPLQ